MGRMYVEYPKGHWPLSQAVRLTISVTFSAVERVTHLYKV